tara:strand:+ start:3167 stop:3340 length:174 start_codon:yes stop_codon:yes gene_type:complete
MNLEYGLLLGFLGCVVTVTVFFIAFLIINYNMKKEIEQMKQKQELKKNPYYFGDDTV